MRHSPYVMLDFSSGRRNVASSKAAMILGALDWGMRSGVPLHEALATLVKRRLKIGALSTEIFGCERRWVPAVSLAAEALEKGMPVSEALRHLEFFLPEYVFHALKEAERRGRVEETLSVLHESVSRSDSVYKRRLNAFCFPLAELFVCSGIMAFTLSLVMPRFFKMLGEFFQEIPPSPFFTFLPVMADSALYFFYGALLVPPSLMVFRFFHRREPVARAVFEALMLRLPFLGRDAKRMAILEAAVMMSALLAAGCDMREAAEVARSASRSYWFKKRLSVFVERLDGGGNWADAWEAMELGFPFLDWLVRNAALREEPGEGFLSMSLFLSNEISSFSVVFAKAVEVLGIFFNASLAVLMMAGVFLFLIHITRYLSATAPLGM